MTTFFELDAPQGMKFNPAPWQLEDLAILEQKQHSCNFSEMGCYKTSTGLWLMELKGAEYRKQFNRQPACLIITSKAGKGTYWDAFPKCIPDWNTYNVYARGISELVDRDYEVPVEDDFLTVLKDGVHNRPIVLLAHYNVFTNRCPIGQQLLGIPFCFVLCDEAHKIKNKDTQWTRNIKKLNAWSKHLMTGTGFVNRPDEIWSLLNFLNREKFGGYWNFRQTYCEEFFDPRGYRVITGLKQNKIEQFRTLRKSLGPRREMQEVHADIAEPITTTRDVDLNPTQRKMYNEIRDLLQTLDKAGEPITSPNVLSQLNRLRQISVATPEVTGRWYDDKAQRMVTDIQLTEPSSKLDEVMDILDEIDEDKKVVVFSNFRDPLYLLKERFDKAGIPFLHMEQKHSDQQRYSFWHDQFPNSIYRVFMSTLSLGGESINLTPAQYLIFLDKSWSPTHMMQGVGRVFRPGQRHPVEVIHINARNTTDQYLSDKLKIKGRWFDAIFNK